MTVHYTRVESPYLTERDREMLALIADDHGYKQVGVKLGISDTAVRKRMATLRRDFAAHSAVGLIVRLLHLGILVLDQMPLEVELRPIEIRRRDQAQAAGEDETA